MPDYSITDLDISPKGLTKLTKLPDDIEKYTNLKILNCSYNKITILDYLPPTLKELYCCNNKITSLDNLPQNLEVLECWINKITSLDNLPPTLKELECSFNPFKYDFVLSLENIQKYNASRLKI